MTRLLGLGDFDRNASCTPYGVHRLIFEILVTCARLQMPPKSESKKKMLEHNAKLRKLQEQRNMQHKPASEEPSGGDTSKALEQLVQSHSDGALAGRPPGPSDAGMRQLLQSMTFTSDSYEDFRNSFSQPPKLKQEQPEVGAAAGSPASSVTASSSSSTSAASASTSGSPAPSPSAGAGSRSAASVSGQPPAAATSPTGAKSVSTSTRPIASVSTRPINASVKATSSSSTPSAVSGGSDKSSQLARLQAAKAALAAEEARALPPSSSASAAAPALPMFGPIPPPSKDGPMSLQALVCDGPRVREEWWRWPDSVLCMIRSFQSIPFWPV
jgi:hypothetical protein